MARPEYPTWLVRLLTDYRHLRIGAAVGQFRDHDPETAVVPHWQTCAYCSGDGKPCTHEAQRFVGPGVVTKEPIVSWWNLDPMLCRQMAVDFDRFIESRPGRALQFFHLLYRTYAAELNKDGELVMRNRTIAEVAKLMRLTVADAVQCHDHHICIGAEMLADYAPRRSA
jgi:hypothetical protein